MLNFPWLKKKPEFERSNHTSRGDLCFRSTAALERGLDGGDDRFYDYFFAVYHCSPDEPSGISDLREQLRSDHPELAINVGKRFILSGEAAYKALGAYYSALIQNDNPAQSEDFRQYARECFDRITEMHNSSQSLPIPINLTEGELNQDHRLEFLTCIAIYNGQIMHKDR